MKINPKISERLLRWYKQHGRTLPWRTSFSPYSVWLSEIMLQQTQVETVVPYFYRFLSSFPDLDSLARAPIDHVLKQWEGLGYYSRARNLHRTAQMIGDQFNGRFPDRYEDLIKLPGIGKSTAGAILSLAFNQPFPILDGNVRRVLTRLFAVQIEPGPKLDKVLWKFSTELVPGDARNFNSALMDLGATICKPREPLCRICPFKSDCKGFENNLHLVLPLKKKKPPVPLHFHSALVISKNQKVFIRKRPMKGLLGGLWEFPEELVGQTPLADQSELIRAYQNLGFKVKIRDFLFKISHAFTHFKMELHVFKAIYDSGKNEQNENARWVSLNELRDFAFSSSHKKIIENLRSTNLKIGKTSKR